MSEPKILELVKKTESLEKEIKTNVTTGEEFATNFILDGKQVYGKRIEVGAINADAYHNTGLSNCTLVACFGNAYNKVEYAPIIPGREVGVHFENRTKCNRVWISGLDGYSAILTILYIKNKAEESEGENGKDRTN